MLGHLQLGQASEASSRKAARPHLGIKGLDAALQLAGQHVLLHPAFHALQRINHSVHSASGSDQQGSSCGHAMSG